MFHTISVRGLAAGCLAAALLSAPAAAGATTTPSPTTEPPTTGAAGHLMVVGDSISAAPRYGTEADEPRFKAWWAYVLDSFGPGWTHTISAQAGSGMLNRGNARPTDLTDLDTTNARCNGTSFGQRLQAVRDARPTVLIIEGGRNDFKKCVDNQLHRATEAETKTAVAAYLRDLGTTVDSIGLARSSVYVMVPWGTTFANQRDVVTYAVERHARARGFSYVPLPIVAQKDTIDGTHPNEAGSKRLAAQVLAASDLRRFAGGPTPPVASGVTQLCVGYSACATKNGRIGYQSVRSGSFWSQHPTKYSTNYVAYRLTHEGRRTARIPGKTAAQWRDGARTAGVPITGLPKAGAVAWWPNDPVSGSAAGHVAYVTKVGADSVTVAEVRPGSRYAVTTYSGAAYPRGFLHFPRSDGSPTGKVSITPTTRAKSLRLKGYVTDPSRYGKPVPIVVKVTKGRKTVVLTPRQRSRFDLAMTVRSASMPTGKVTVRVYAKNVTGGGKKQVLLSRRTVKVPAR